MSKTGWLKTILALTLLFAAGFVLIGNKRFDRWLRGETQLVTTTRPVATTTDEDDDPLQLSNESLEWVSHHRKVAAMAIMVLLGSDMLLPVPSSVVMTTNGRLFGFASGTFVSFVGSMLAWLGCYWLGRLFGWTGQKKNPNGEPGRADLISRQVARFGVGMLIVTRPVPILAELVAAACGVAKMNFWRFLAGSALGVLPMSLVYAYVGNHYRDSRSPWIALVIAIFIPLLFYLAFAQPWRKTAPR